MFPCTLPHIPEIEDYRSPRREIRATWNTFDLSAYFVDSFASITKRGTLVVIDVPDWLDQFRHAVESAKTRILSLEEDWDDEGAPSFDAEHWERLNGFITGLAESFSKNYNGEIAAPRIVPVPTGTIDVHWKTESRELLVNFPSDSSKPPTYYGDNYGSGKIRGSLDLTADNMWLAVWLTGR